MNVEELQVSDGDKQIVLYAYGQRWQKTSLQCLQRVSQGQAANYPDEIEIMFNQTTNPERR
jgi:hypothetical protein